MVVVASVKLSPPCRCAVVMPAVTRALSTAVVAVVVLVVIKVEVVLVVVRAVAA